MSLYLETSLRVAALIKEAATAATQIRLAAQNVDDFAVSDWVTTEFSAVLSIKLRAGQITVGERAEVLAMFARLSTDSFEALSVKRQYYRTSSKTGQSARHRNPRGRCPASCNLP